MRRRRRRRAVPSFNDVITKADRSATYQAPIAGFLTVRTAASRPQRLGPRPPRRGDRPRPGQLARVRVARGRADLRHRRADGSSPAEPGSSGKARRLRVSFQLFEVALPKADGTPQLITVKYSDDEDLARIEAAGLDLTHDIHGGQAAVIVTGAEQLAALRALEPAVRGRGRRSQPADRRRPRRRRPRRRRRPAAPRCLRPRGVPRPAGLPGRAQGARRRQPGAGQARRAAEAHLPGPRDHGRRDRQGRRPHRRRPPDLLPDGHAPRPRVAFGRVAMEFAHLLVNGADSDPRISEPARARAGRRRADDQRRRLRRVARGRRARDPRSRPTRPASATCRPSRASPCSAARSPTGARTATARSRAAASRARCSTASTRTATTATAGAARAPARPDHPELPRDRPVLRARDPGGLGVLARAAGDDDDHPAQRRRARPAAPGPA